MKKLLFVLLFVPLVSFGQDAKEYSESAIDKLLLEDYKGAIDDFTKAIELDPNYPNAYSYIGND